MSLFLANPWGLAALAAVPALLLIHALRQRSRRIRTSTMFLLEHAGPPPEGGLRFERLRRSVPLALQMLAAVTIAWLLAEPRLVARRARQTVAVVLDGSASMGAFREEARRVLGVALRRVAGAAYRTDWHLLVTGPRQAPLYAGDRLDGLLAALDGWRPVLGTHDPNGTLATAANLDPGGRGTVVFVTDRDVPVADTVGVLAVGTPIDNVGFAVGDVVDADDGTRWRTVVTNPGATPQERSLRVLRATDLPPTAAAERTIRLDAGETRTLEGAWPDGAAALVLELSGDRFPFDDRLPVVRPVARRVRVAVRTGGDSASQIERILRAVADVDVVAADAEADLVVASLGATVAGAAVLLVPPAETTDAADGSTDAPAATAPLDAAALAAEDHPLVRELGWGGLLSGPALDTVPQAGDQTLVWKGDRPLVVLRGDDGGPEALLLAWDVARSNAARLPAMIVLLDRFVDRVRTRLDRRWAANFLVEEVIEMPAPPTATMAVQPTDPAAPRPAPAPFRGQAPSEPALFTVADGATARLVGAAQGADARESDFRAAATLDTLSRLEVERRRKESIADPWLPAWLALIAGALAGAWAWPAWRRGGLRDAAGGQRR